MRILVTGGAGFIGSNLVNALLSAGNQVGVIDNMSTGSVANLHPAAWFRSTDITSPQFAAVLAEFAPEVVVHLAAQSSISASEADPVHDRAVNVGGTEAVARAAAAAGARRVISASSAAVYGTPVSLPLGEADRKAPDNPYGASKLEAESVLAAELRPTGVDFASMRFANVYGPRQNPYGEGGVVAIISGRIAEELPPVINGDGSQTRDFIYVGDIVSAIMLASEYPGELALPGEDGPAYNLSTGTETSITMLVQAMRGPGGYFGPVEHASAVSPGVPRSALNPGKAHEVFGFTARVGIEAGLARTVGWFKQF